MSSRLIHTIVMSKSDNEKSKSEMFIIKDAIGTSKQD
jgi:hypothetical protein